MSTRITVLIGLALVLAAVLLSVAVYDRLPAQMASHWDATNQVNGYMPRFWGAFVMPLLALAMLALFLVVPLIDPMKANVAAFRGTFNVFIVAMLTFLLFLHAVVLAWNLGFQGFAMSTVLLPGVGLIFILAGVMMRQAKRNFFIGIRTPWTLSSDRVWDKTHRVGGPLFILCGLISLFGVFVPGPVAFALVLVPILLATVFLLVYSYLLYVQETHA